MRLPNGANAIVSDEKLYDFLVNRRHPRQAGHAELFHRLLGINESNAEMLRQSLLDAAASKDAVPGKPSQYGSKHEIRFEMTGDRGTFSILSVWINRRGEDIPWLVTAFVDLD
jgi:hypothetical protein